MDVFEAHADAMGSLKGKFIDSQECCQCFNTIPYLADAPWSTGIVCAPCLACTFDQTTDSISLFMELGQTLN